MTESIKELANNLFEEIVVIRRHIHEFPELSFNEHQTSAYIKSILNKWNIPFIENIAKNGIVALIKGKNAAKKTIALRADFDALPIIEENNVPYCSKNKGVMHACGHDVHTACLLGALKILDSLKKDWEGSIKFIFQPAEEQYPGGAKEMIEQGVLDNPKVQKMFGQHVFPEMEVGKVGFCMGKYMASADEIEIKISGVGGHAALLDQYNSPIIAAVELIHRLENYFLPYRDIPSVFAIGSFQAGGHYNIIPEHVDLKGTLRVIDEEFRDKAHMHMKVISKDVAEKYSVGIDFNIRKGYPALYNNIPLTRQAILNARKYLGDENVIDLSERMTAEDFAYYCQKVPSCFYRLGTANQSEGITYGLHTSRFNVDEESLKIGMGLMAYLAINS